MTRPSLPTISEYLSIIALGVAYPVTSNTLRILSHGSEELFERLMPGTPLPTLTNFVLTLPDKVPVFFLAVVIGTLVTAALLWIRTINRARDYLLFAVTCGWAAIFVFHGMIMMAFFMPFVVMLTGLPAAS